MASILSGDRGESVSNAMHGTVRTVIKDAVKEALYEYEGESSRRSGSGGSGSLVLFGAGAALGYVLRGRAKGLLSGAAMEDADLDEVIGETGIDDVVEGPTEMLQERTEPDRGEEGRSLGRVLLLTGTLALVSYLLRRRGASPTEMVGAATDRVRSTSEEAAQRADEATEQAAEHTEAVAGDVADRIEEGGEEAAEGIDETGDEAADSVEMGGHEAADEMESAAEKMEDEEEEDDEDEF